MKKLITMVAGPNGAGKTTTALALVAEQKNVFYEFLNADEIARGLAPKHPESVALEASKLMLKRFRLLLDAGKNFVFETTASAQLYIKYLKEARATGYQINLIFLWLSSVEQAIKRVANRVKQGGHNIPEEDIGRRYHRGLMNLFNHYLPLADTFFLIDNSSAESSERKIIARKSLKEQVEILDRSTWDGIQEVAYVKR